MDLNIGGERGLTLGASTWALRSTAELRLADWVTPAVGVDWTYTGGTFRAALGQAPREGEPAYFGPTRRDPLRGLPFWQSQLGLWTELRLRPFPALLIIPGVRMDLVDIRLQRTPLLTADPRLAVRWAVLPEVLTLKMGVGLYHAPPSLQAGEVDATFGNPDLGSRYALQTSVGAEWNIRPDLLLSVEGFYNRLWDIPVSTSALIERNGQLVPENLVNDGRGRISASSCSSVRH